jgi:hypothetical protein
MKIHDKYATKPRTIKPIFIRAIGILGSTTDRREANRINILLFKTTVIRTNRPILIRFLIRFHADTAKDIGRIIQRTYERRIQKRRKNLVRGDNTRPKA